MLSLISGPPLASVNGPSGLSPTATPMFIQPAPLPLIEVYQ